MSPQASNASGSCLCGAVTFSIAFPTNWIAHCHCTICRRAHGAAFVTWVSVPDDKYTVSDSGGLLRWYRSSRDGERAFCSRCGSSLFFRGSQWPGEVHIPRGNFTSALDQAPQVHSFYETHVDWFEINDGLPKET